MNEKIYSRFRLFTPKINYSNMGKEASKNSFVIVIVIFVIAYFTALSIIDSLNPTIERQSKILARSTAEKLSNEACKEIMQNVKYEDLCNLEKDSNGKIQMISLNVITVNKISSDIALKIQNELLNIDNNEIGVSLGTITGYKILAGRGPKIKIQMKTIGDIETSVKSELMSGGINQTINKIYINIDCNLSIISPYKDTDENITTQVLLAESVIVGDIPETYYNLNGMNVNDSMDIIE